MASSTYAQAVDGEMVDPRMERMKMISESVARDEYRVDPVLVAEAILRRLLEARGD